MPYILGEERNTKFDFWNDVFIKGTIKMFSLLPKNNVMQYYQGVVEHISDQNQPMLIPVRFTTEFFERFSGNFKGTQQVWRGECRGRTVNGHFQQFIRLKYADPAYENMPKYANRVELRGSIVEEVSTHSNGSCSFLIGVVKENKYLNYVSCKANGENAEIIKHLKISDRLEFVGSLRSVEVLDSQVFPKNIHTNVIVNELISIKV